MTTRSTTFPNIPAAEVGEFIKDQIEIGKATKVVAEKQGNTWTVTVTRPIVGG